MLLAVLRVKLLRMSRLERLHDGLVSLHHILQHHTVQLSGWPFEESRLRIISIGDMDRHFFMDSRRSHHLLNGSAAITVLDGHHFLVFPPFAELEQFIEELRVFRGV